MITPENLSAVQEMPSSYRVDIIVRRWFALYVVKYADLKERCPGSTPARVRGPASNFLEWGIR